MRAQKFHKIYRSLLRQLVLSPAHDNQRTGHKIKALNGGTSFLLNLKDNVLPTPGLRKVFPKSSAAEVAWYLSGNQDVTWLRKYTPMWNKFVEDDGQTVENSYGYRWKHYFQRDQIEGAIQALQSDPTSRQVMVTAWDPSLDGLGPQGRKAKNIPCPTNFTLSIIGGRLHSSLFLRSSDVFVGLPYDVMGHALLVAAFAQQLEVKLGTIHFTLAHAHLYDSHWDDAWRAIGEIPRWPQLMMPNYTIHDIVFRPDDYVECLIEKTRQHGWPLFNPHPEVIE